MDRPELQRLIADLQPGEVVVAEKMDRISRLPLLYEHINMLGRYSFSMPEAVAKGELRPLRDLLDPSQA